MSKSVVLPEYFKRQGILLASVLDGLRFSCVSSSYLNNTWLKEKFGFSENGGKFSNTPYDYIQYWYQPLLRCGSTLPFFLVLDLGLTFLERSSIEFCDREEIIPYRDLLRHLTNTHESSIRALIHDIQEDMLQIQQYERRERLPLAQRRTRAVFSRLCFQAVPVFIERLLPHLEQMLLPVQNYRLDNLHSLDDLRYGNFEWPLEGCEIDWSRAAQNQERLLPAKVQEEYKQTGMKDFNQNFFHALCKVSSQQKTPPKFSAVEELAVRTACVDWANQPPLSTEDTGAKEEPNNDFPCLDNAAMYSEMDLTLLSNYCRHHMLRLEEGRQKIHSFNKRVLISNLARSRQPGGGLQEIGMRGRIANLLKSQLGLLRVHPELFYYKLYNHKLLYYMNMVSRYRPTKILTAVVVDVGPSTRTYLPGIGYKNALARELAAYLIEDACRSVSELQGVTLDISIQLCWPNNVEHGPFFLRFSEDHAKLLKEGVPLVTGLAEIPPSMFKLDTTASAAIQLTQSEEDTFTGADCIPVHLRTALEGINRRAQQETEINFSETGRRSSAIPYDCSHVALITGDIRDKNNEPSFFEEAFESYYRSTLARRSFFHQFALREEHVDWATGMGESPKQETYSNMRDGSTVRPGSPALAADLPGRLRREFVGRIIGEAVRDCTSFLA